MIRRAAIATWGLYAITDREMAGGRSHAEIGAELIEGGVRVLQVRDKKTPFEQLIKDVARVVELAHPRGVTVIVNDNPYLARDSGADGVHLGQSDISVAVARDILGPDRLVGLSAHTRLQALRAQAEEVDYVGLGPIFTTKTKVQGYLPLGLATVRWAAAQLRVPFVCIGGITEELLANVLAAGARHCAMISALMASPDIAATTRRIVQLCDQLSREDDL